MTKSTHPTIPGRARVYIGASHDILCRTSPFNCEVQTRPARGSRTPRCRNSHHPPTKVAAEPVFGLRRRVAGTRAIIAVLADVAQLARASACHAEGRGFESLHPLRRKALPTAGLSSFQGSEMSAPTSAGTACGYHFGRFLAGAVLWPRTWRVDAHRRCPGGCLRSDLLGFPGLPCAASTVHARARVARRPARSR
jgi:hypothetical protein